jgi:hypothetical protein
MTNHHRQEEKPVKTQEKQKLKPSPDLNEQDYNSQ